MARTPALAALLFLITAMIPAVNGGLVSDSGGVRRYQENFDDLLLGTTPCAGIANTTQCFYTVTTAGTGTQTVVTAPAGLTGRAWQSTDSGVAYGRQMQNNGVGVNLCTSGQTVAFVGEVGDLALAAVVEYRIYGAAITVSQGVAESIFIRLTGQVGTTNTVNYGVRGVSGVEVLSASGSIAADDHFTMTISQVNCSGAASATFTDTGIAGLAPSVALGPASSGITTTLNRTAVIHTTAAGTAYMDDYDWQGAPTPGADASDTDSDGILNSADNCPTTPNPSQTNQDGDSLGDACDSDIDGDGLPNINEAGFAGDADRDDDFYTDGPAVPANNPASNQTGHLTAQDNCPNTYNPAFGNPPHQNDTDGDGVGDLCEGGDIANAAYHLENYEGLTVGAPPNRTWYDFEASINAPALIAATGADEYLRFLPATDQTAYASFHLNDIDVCASGGIFLSGGANIRLTGSDPDRLHMGGVGSRNGARTDPNGTVPGFYIATDYDTVTNTFYYISVADNGAVNTSAPFNAPAVSTAARFSDFNCQAGTATFQWLNGATVVREDKLTAPGSIATLDYINIFYKGPSSANTYEYQNGFFQVQVGALGNPTASLAVSNLTGADVDDSGTWVIYRYAGGETVGTAGAKTLTPSASPATTNCAPRNDGVAALADYVVFLRCDPADETDVTHINIKSPVDLFADPPFPPICVSGSDFCISEISDNDMETPGFEMRQVADVEAYPFDYSKAAGGGSGFRDDSVFMAFSFTATGGKVGIVTYTHNDNAVDTSDLAYREIAPTGIPDQVCTARDERTTPGSPINYIFGAAQTGTTRGLTAEFRRVNNPIGRTLEVDLADMGFQGVVPASNAVSCGQNRVLVGSASGTIHMFERSELGWVQLWEKDVIAPSEGVTVSRNGDWMGYINGNLLQVGYASNGTLRGSFVVPNGTFVGMDSEGSGNGYWVFTNSTVAYYDVTALIKAPPYDPGCPLCSSIVPQPPEPPAAPRGLLDLTEAQSLYASLGMILLLVAVGYTFTVGRRQKNG